MKIKVGISACLLGERVRYDGALLDPFLTDRLGGYVEFVPVCPEVECGLGVPREPMQLEVDTENPRLVTIRGRIDLTERMLAWVGMRLAGLAGEDLRGFVFKSRSPSCGIEVMVYRPDGQPLKSGVGIFARAFMERFPAIPVADEEQLRDPRSLEDFIGRVLA